MFENNYFASAKILKAEIKLIFYTVKITVLKVIYETVYTIY